MTLSDLKKEIVKRLSIRRSQDNELEPEGRQVVYISDYDRLKRLNPTQRYQKMKSDNFNTRFHKSIRYWNYLELFNSIAPDPFTTRYETGEQRMDAYWHYSNLAEAELVKLYPNPLDQGCTNSKCVRSCRFYKPEGTIDDKELEEYFRPAA